jgi:branched-chain amino acid transport system permease protein
VAVILGSVTLKLSGHFLPLGTMAWGISLYFLFGNMEFLGGHGGLSGIPPISLFGFELLDNRQSTTCLGLRAGVSPPATCSTPARRAIRAPQGRHGDGRGDGRGYLRARMVIFVIAALHACAAGWLYAHLQRFVNPTPSACTSASNTSSWRWSAAPGRCGALVGAGVITVLKQWLQDILPKVFGSAGNFEVIVFGVMMVIVLQRARDGLWPLLAGLVPVRAAQAPSTRRRAAAQEAAAADGRDHPRSEGVTRKFGGLVANNNMSLS